MLLIELAHLHNVNVRKIRELFSFLQRKCTDLSRRNLNISSLANKISGHLQCKFENINKFNYGFTSIQLPTSYNINCLRIFLNGIFQ